MKAFFIFLSLCISPFSLAAYAETTAPSYNRINLSSFASSEVENDLKVVELFASYQDASSAKASNQVNRDIKWALEIAKDKGLESRTLEYHTQPIYEPIKNSNNRNKIVGWT